MEQGHTGSLIHHLQNYLQSVNDLGHSDSSINWPFQETNLSDTSDWNTTPSHHRLREFYFLLFFFMRLAFYLSCDFLLTWWLWSPKEIQNFDWSPKKIWPGFNDQQTNSDDLKYLHFCLKVSSCYPAIISEMMESLVYCRLKNSSIIPGFGNKDSIQLTFISSCCLEFGTIVGQFWKVLVIFEIASHLTSYHLFSPANFSQCTHEWLFFCTLNISLILTIYDIGHQYAEPQGILMKWPLM